MKVKDLYGRERNVNLKKYLIDWERPACSQFQTSIQKFLFLFWRNHIVTSEYLIPASRLRCDILNWSKMIAIEADGIQHEKFSKHFHRNRSNFLASFRRDFQKEKWLEEIMGFTVIRITPTDLPLLSRQWFIDKYNVDLI